MSGDVETSCAAGDLFGALSRDPHQARRWMQRQAPVHFARANDTYFVTRHADIQHALRNPAFGRSARGPRPFTGARLPCPSPLEARARAERLMGGWLGFLGSSDHRAARALLSPYFKGNWVQVLSAAMAQTTQDCFDRIADDAPFDIITELIYPVTFVATATLLGLPKSTDLVVYREWNGAIDQLLNVCVPQKTREIGYFAIAALASRLEDALALAPPDPRASLMGACKGQDVLSHEQLLSLMSLLFSVGHTTSANFLGNAIYTLARHPDAYRKLRRDPASLDAAIRELLRYEPPIKLLSRTALSDTQIAGYPIRRGQNCQFLLVAAHFDAAVYDDPERFDIARAPASTLAFGAGVHTCIGLRVAMMAARSVLVALLERSARIELLDPALLWTSSAVLRGLEKLTVRISA